MEMKC